MNKEGHIGLSNRKVNEATCGEFFGALSCLEVNKSIAYFVIHVYSNTYTYDYSPHLQRSNVRGHDQRENFLERLGFNFSDSCNILPGNRCYHKVVEEVVRGRDAEDILRNPLRVNMIHEIFKKFMFNLKEIYDEMAKIDRMLFEAGIELPWADLKLSPVTYEIGEKVYQKGQVYDFYKDIRDITTQAKNEVFLIDAYPDEEVLDLYLEKVPLITKIRILTNKPMGNFLTVAEKFKLKPGINFEVRASKDCHDRLFFIDDNCWVMVQSLKDAGKKPTYLVKIESSNSFREVFEDLWSQAQNLV